jgi:isopentenyl diphosphate isomerase/L-lactate dehydrogenase-like FMN-dependent dehydrogenase
MKPYNTIAEMREDALEILRKKPSFLERIRWKTQAWLDLYLEGWAGTSQTVRNNEQAFHETQVAPQFLKENKLYYRDIPGMNSRNFLRTDIFVAPTAWHKLFYPGGEYVTSRATEAFDRNWVGFMVASSFSQTPLHHLLGKKWYQMMPIIQEGIMKRTIDEAHNRWVGALVLTVDAPNGCTACRTSWNKPDRVSVADMPLLPKGNMFTGKTLKDYLAHHMPSNGYDFRKKIQFIIENSSLPVYLKGIMTPEDAEEAKKMWAAGIYVSNHGGRQYDRGISTLEAVRRIRDKIGGDFPLIMDGGIRTGQDIVIARRAGADMVGIGRPIHYGLTVGGESGVKKVFEILTNEMCETLELGM